MALQKRLDYGFTGYQVPAIPRSSRSARGRRSFKKKVEDDKMCAFDLLAIVAGKLLQESEAFHASTTSVLVGGGHPAIANATVKHEQHDEDKLLKVERTDLVCCNESVIVSQPKDFQRAQDDGDLELINITANSNSSEKFAQNKNKNRKFFNKVEEGGSPCFGESYEGKVVDGNVPDTCSSEYPMDLDTKPPPLVTSDSSIEVPMRRDHIVRRSFPEFRDDVKVVSKDDDENSSGCTQPSTVTLKAYRPAAHIGDRRMRKLFASNYWKLGPKLKDGELFNSDKRSIFRNRKTCYTRQRSQRNSPFKRRKLYEQSSRSASEGRIGSEDMSNLFNKGLNGDASRASSSVVGQESSSHSTDPHVKLSIKSFRVPELFIEIPETATVAFLKKKVTEAVTAMLGGGLRVGVVLGGKKVGDDNSTLLQTGILHDDKLDSLGFTLEPNPSPPSPPPSCDEDPSFLVHCSTPQPLTRYLTTPFEQGPSDASQYPPVISLSNLAESDHDSVLSPTTDISANKTTPDSRALVAIPTSVEALAMIPMHRKSKRSELVQRRIRRPFSVSEVEALVQAVEKLGTGRWRDVKLRAFDNAKHRTYVDLKDKWKTLVHTARISPQQRRGEPVPQELLDRVLSAHAYWSQQQAKQQAKQQTETCLLL
ncbi:hypothetical protein GIB67_040518 [Kingdonia uniflora]|uniref:Uncharacterized protein n=1 Tax=Kingdonia uniflora TaxID=39325 RepID=A0A7J7L5D4_9MAGN|nr:hypothetical protein GIB67_040518 [Kingdonia uniflora]